MTRRALVLVKVLFLATAAALTGCATESDGEGAYASGSGGHSGHAGAGGTHPGSGGSTSHSGGSAGMINTAGKGGSAQGGAAGVSGSAGGGNAGAQHSGDELCGDGFDNNGDGQVDEGCACAVGSAQKCYLGDPSLAGKGKCAWGKQTCEKGSEEVANQHWGACTGSGKPAAETCNDVDDDCDGEVDEDVANKPCGCHPPAEICDNGKDDDCDGVIDDGCQCLDAGVAPWEIYRDLNVHCFGEDLDGNAQEFNFSSVPAENSGGWKPWGSLTVDFTDPSTIPDPEFCGCKHCGGVFTYFQTFVDIPAGYVISSVRVAVGGADDGWKVTVNGSSSASWYSWHTAKTVDVTSKIKHGHNRIVLTHIDDNPVTRALNQVHVQLNGKNLGACK